LLSIIKWEIWDLVDLYKNGIQRSSFIPTIQLLKERCLVHSLDSGVDYRQRSTAKKRVFFYPKSPEADTAIAAVWNSLTHNQKGIYENSAPFDLFEAALNVY
jgi:peroxisome-assembly ATPase